MKKKSGKKQNSKSKLVIILVVFILAVFAVGAYFTYDFIRVKDKTVSVSINGIAESKTVQVKMCKVLSLTEPIVEGYDFKGWFYDAEFSKPFNHEKNFVFKELSLYAKMEIKTFNITFMSNGGNETPTINFKYNSFPKEPLAPNKKDYMFAGWYLDSEFTQKFNFDEVDNQNITLYANWILISDALVYSKNYGTVSITGYKSGISPYLYLPDTIEGTAVQRIESQAFKDCLILKEVNILNKDLSIGNAVFAGCNSLEKMTVPLNEISINFANYFSSNTAIPESLKSVVLIEGQTALRQSAFSGCKYLEEIVLPNSLLSIGEAAFAACENLKTIVIPESVTSLSQYAFVDCYSLDNIVIPESIEYIENGVFMRCRNLKSITLPRGLLKIGITAFSQCIELKELTIPDSVIEIGVYAFEQCKKITKINLPDSITIIKENTFLFCDNLIEIKLPINLIRIESSAFSNCSSLQTIVFPDTLNFIGNAAFSNCSSLSSIEIPSSVKVLNYGIFSFCINLKNIILNEGLTEIQYFAFGGNSNLKEIVIPSTVVMIGESVFGGCNVIESITLLSTTPPTLNVPIDIIYSAKIYVPSASVNAYKAANNWINISQMIYPIAE